MQGKRSDRVGHLIQKELSSIILERVKDPRLGFVTINYVKMTPDLKSAVIFFSVMGDEKAKKDSLLVLSKASGFLKREIGAVLKLRYTPRLQFELDDSIDKSFEITDVIKKMKEKDQTQG